MLGIDEGLSDQSGRLAAGARKAGSTLRIRAVGHLQPTLGLTVFTKHDAVVDGACVSQFHVQRLPGRQMAASGHDVQRCQSAGYGSPKARIVDVNGVHDPGLGLNGSRRVGAAPTADVTVRADQTGHEDATLAVHHGDALAIHVQCSRRAQGHNHAVSNQHVALREFSVA